MTNAVPLVSPGGYNGYMETCGGCGSRDTRVRRDEIGDGLEYIVDVLVCNRCRTESRGLPYSARLVALKERRAMLVRNGAQDWRLVRLDDTIQRLELGL